RAAETTQHAYSRLIAWTLIGLVWIRRGRLARAVLPLERAMEACRRKHLTVWLPIPLSLLGLAFVRMGHIVEGLRLLEEGVTLSRELGIRAYLSAWLVNLAEGLFAAGHVSRARETAGQALELAHECGERGHEAQALQMLGANAPAGPAPACRGAARGVHGRDAAGRGAPAPAARRVMPVEPWLARRAGGGRARGPAAPRAGGARPCRGGRAP